MTDEIRNKISAFAQKKLCYTDADIGKENLQIFHAFNVEKMCESSNSGDYKYSSLATLGDSVAGLLLCTTMFYQSKRKGEITVEKLSLQNKVLDEVSRELGLPDYRYNGEKFGEQNKETQFKNDPSALFEAVLGAIFLDYGYEKTKKFWDAELYPMIEGHYSLIRIAGKEKEAAQSTTLFNTYVEELNEIYVCRFKKWNKKAKNEISKGTIYFDKSESRGFQEQGIFFYKNATLEAWKEYSRLSKKTPDCLIVYRLTRDNLPKARQKDMNTEYKTELVQVQGTKHAICLKTQGNVDDSISAQIAPNMVLFFSEEAETITEIIRFSAQSKCPFFEITPYVT